MEFEQAAATVLLDGPYAGMTIGEAAATDDGLRYIQGELDKNYRGIAILEAYLGDDCRKGDDAGEADPGPSVKWNEDGSAEFTDGADVKFRARIGADGDLYFANYSPEGDSFWLTTDVCRELGPAITNFGETGKFEVPEAGIEIVVGGAGAETAMDFIDSRMDSEGMFSLTMEELVDWCASVIDGVGHGTAFDDDIDDELDELEERVMSVEDRVAILEDRLRRPEIGECRNAPAESPKPANRDVVALLNEQMPVGTRVRYFRGDLCADGLPRTGFIMGGFQAMPTGGVYGWINGLQGAVRAEDIVKV